MLEEYYDVDRKIFNIGKRIRPLFYLNPINAEGQKEAFLSGKIKSPSFEYMQIDPDDNPDEIEKELNLLIVPEGMLKEIYENKITELKLLNSLVKLRGNPKKITHTAINVFGEPNKSVSDEALKILEKEYVGGQDNNVGSKEIVKEIRAALARNNINDWAVELIEGTQVLVHSEMKRMYVGKDALRPEAFVKSMVVHDVSWHAMRASNGYNQRLKIFAQGFPGSFLAEEGGALFLESMAGTLSYGSLRTYAGRVVAVKCFLDGLGFSEVFNYLRSFDFSENESWAISLRVFRGGGITRDYIYLKGLLEMKKFIKKKEDLNTFFIGKIGLNDVQFVQALIDSKIILPPFYLPDILK